MIPLGVVVSTRRSEIDQGKYIENESMNIYSRTKDELLEILFLDKNHVDSKIACGLAEGFLSFIKVLSANTTPFLTFITFGNSLIIHLSNQYADNIYFFRYLS